MYRFSTAVWLVGLGWICNLHCLMCVMQDYWDDPSHLQCGFRAMNFSLPSLMGDSEFVLTVIDAAGRSHYLHNNSTCGSWVGQKPDGSVVIGAAYDGCYVREEDGDYVMTISLEEVLRNGRTRYHKKDLKCPIPLAMDAPSQSVCASVKQTDRLMCADTSVSRELCENNGCCFSPNDFAMPCYYGNPLTAWCTTDSHMVVAISKDLTSPSLILDSVVPDVDSALCPQLKVSKTDSFASFQFPLSCGGTKQATDKAIYEHTFVATKDVRQWGKASITRDSTIRLTVSCSYSQTGVVPLLKVEVNTLPPPLPVNTSGPLFLEMRIAKDVQYSSYYADGDYPITKVLRDPVFLEVRILQRNDPSLVLVLNNCWATHTPAPTEDPQWPILFNRCPFSGDNYLTQLTPVGAPSQNIPFPTYYQRFIVSTFTFVAQDTQVALDGLVYFHCSASVCVPSASESCAINCGSRKRRMVDNRLPDVTLTTVTSDGPVIFYADEIVSSQDSTRDDADLLLGSSSAMTWLRGAAAVGVILGLTFVAIGLYRRQNVHKETSCQRINKVTF